MKVVKTELKKTEITAVSPVDNGDNIAQMALNAKINHPNVSKTGRDQ